MYYQVRKEITIDKASGTETGNLRTEDNLLFTASEDNIFRSKK